MFHRKICPEYVNVPRRQLRQYEAPVMIEYQSENATFERSILFKGARYWNWLPVETHNMVNYESFKRNRKNVMLSNIL